LKKIRKNITIPEEVNRDFKDIVAQLEGPFKKGAESKWITRVLTDFIKSHSIQQQCAKSLQFVQPGQKEIRKTRELMQQIVKNISWDHGIKINRGTVLPVKHVRDAIIKIRNLDPKDPRTVTKWINRLIEREFIRIKSYNIYEVLETGQDWSELETEDNDQVEKELKELVTE